jgi:hypothetical protein
MKPVGQMVPLMTSHNTLTRNVVAAVTAAAALAAPAAWADPGPPTWPKDPQPIERVSGGSVGPPTWPMHPQRIDAARASDSADDGAGWSTLLLGLAGAALAAAAAAAVGVRRSVASRSRAGVS